jgi:ABC-2 type transport system permease protein
VPALVQVSADGFALRRFAKSAFSLCLFVGVARSGVVALTPLNAVVLAGAVATGLVVFSAIWVATASVAFWIVDAREFGHAFTYGGGFLGSHPLDLYAGWLRRFVTYVLPIAFAVYLPVAYVLGKPARGAALSPLVALAAVGVARAIWQRGVRHYRSTGS